MPEVGYYEERPRKQHREFLRRYLTPRWNVENVKIVDDFRMVVTRTNQSEIRIYLTNRYQLGVADVVEILASAPETTCIVSTMDYNHYSIKAKELARQHGVGLFRARAFLGAVNYDGYRFLDYLPPDEREELRRKNSS
jgi:hypothetical protein